MHTEQAKIPAIFGGAQYIMATKEAPEYAALDPLPLFRREFTVEEGFREAKIALQAPSFGKFYINGRPVTEDVFSSATSDYDKILWYDVYDVTPLLKPGKNALFALLGNGFFNESFPTAWNYDTAPWRDAPQFLLWLWVDGKCVVKSDGTWRASREESYIVYSHLRSGEVADLRKYAPEKMLAGYDDSLWAPALLRTRPVTARFLQTPCPPVRECDALLPKQITPLSDGAYLIDFGVNLSGYAELTLCEERGRRIVLEYAEEVDEAGHPKHNGMNGPNYYPKTPFQREEIIASGGKDAFHPHFAYFGFRYLRIEGLTSPPTEQSLRALFVHQDVARTSRFHAGEPILNFIYNAGIRSTYSNLFWCLTDCPTREKLGWTNDAQASVEQTLFNFDIVPLYEKWFEDIKASMFPDGSLHGTVPAPDWAWGHTCGPVCDGLLFELPYKIYLHKGNGKMLLDGIPCFLRYIAFLEKKIGEGHKFTLGDWTGSGSVETVPPVLLSRLYLLKALDVTALAHRLGGLDAAPLTEKAAALRRELLGEYVDGDGLCTVPTQTAVSMLIAFGIGKKEILGRQLAAIVERDGHMLRAGMVGIQYIYRALSDVGRGDLALRLLRESEPGYRTWMEKGATTLWELWDAESWGSHNHHMYSGVIAWFFRDLAGIRPMEEAPGFARIDFSPVFIKEAGYVSAATQTPYGEVEASWQVRDGGFLYTVTLPEGIHGTFRGKALSPGINVFSL